MNAIETHDLSRAYAGRTVVDRLSLEVAPAGIFGFLGPNGSGKSTTIKMLCGLVRPDSGWATVDGCDVVRQSEALRRAIGYVSQAFSLYDDLTVGQNLEFYGRAYGIDGRERERRKKAALATVGLERYAETRAGALSGGWKQRLALATALLHSPRVLFLDEPTAGIDPVARHDIWDLLFQLAAGGMTLMLTTHYVDEAERCSSVGYIIEGRLAGLGTVPELRALPAVTPPGTHRYGVRAEHVMAAFDALRKFAYVRSVTIGGDEVHVLVESDIDAARLRADLGTTAGAIFDIFASAPSLEDVFTALSRTAAA